MLIVAAMHLPYTAVFEYHPSDAQLEESQATVLPPTNAAPSLIRHEDPPPPVPAAEVPFEPRGNDEAAEQGQVASKKRVSKPPKSIVDERVPVPEISHRSSPTAASLAASRQGGMIQPVSQTAGQAGSHTGNQAARNNPQAGGQAPVHGTNLGSTPANPHTNNVAPSMSGPFTDKKWTPEKEVLSLQKQLTKTSFLKSLAKISIGDDDVQLEKDHLDFARPLRPRTSGSTASISSIGSGSRRTRQNSNVSFISVDETNTQYLNIPFHVAEAAGANRGLFNALNSAQAAGTLGQYKSVGLLAMPTDALPVQSRWAIASQLVAEQQCYPVFASDAARDGHYDGYCKEFLWPTFHCQIPDVPSSKAYEEHSWGDYVTVNQAVADKIVEIYKEGDTVWVHDYHLMLVPQMVREQLPHAAIGFFMHVAFPSSEVFRCLAYRAELLSGVLAANSVAFHVPEYARHFKMCLARLLAVDITAPGVVEEPEHDTFVTTHPLGIDTERLDRILAVDDLNSVVQQHRRVIRQRWPHHRIIAARDKMDPIRGLPQKLKAFDQFLADNPHWATQVVLVQICIPSPQDFATENELDTLVDQINTKYGDIARGFQPVVLLKRDIKYEQYLALLSEADGFCVSCLRDGMNLTCHEYAYCNSAERMGPLILSEFTGSASVLGDYSLLINPWDQHEMAEAFRLCVEMSRWERESRWHGLRADLTSRPAAGWADELTHHIATSWADEMSREAPKPDVGKLQELYHGVGEEKRVFLLEVEHPRSDVASAATNTTVGATGSGSSSAVNTVTNTARNPATSASVAGSPTATSAMPASAATSASASTTSKRSRASSGSAPFGPGSNAITGAFDKVPYYTSRIPLEIRELCTDPRNVVYLISAESPVHMEWMYRSLPGLGLLAEYGKYIRPRGATAWQELDTSAHDDWKDDDWKNKLQPWLDLIERRALATDIVVHDTSITVTFKLDENSAEQRDLSLVGEYVALLNDHYTREIGVRTKLEGHVLTIYRSSLGVQRRNAFDRIVRSVYGPIGFTLVANQPFATDADDVIYEWADNLKKTGRTRELVTLVVGKHQSHAQAMVEGTNALLNLLHEMRTKEKFRRGSNARRNPTINVSKPGRDSPRRPSYAISSRENSYSTESTRQGTPTRNSLTSPRTTNPSMFKKPYTMDTAVE